MIGADSSLFQEVSLFKMEGNMPLLTIVYVFYLVQICIEFADFQNIFAKNNSCSLCTLSFSSSRHLNVHISSHIADTLWEMSIVPHQGICDKRCNLYSRVESTLMGQPNVNVQHSLRYQALRSNM
jgi:hypothetical protein